MSAPAVTAIVATRDRPVLVRQALDAIVAQDYAGPVEVIVVFDQSDPDPSLASDDPRRRIRVTTNSKAAGLAGARNTGIAEATGEYLAFCDDDDEWLPGKLTAQIDLMEAEPDVGLTVTGLEIVYGDRHIVRTLDRERITFEELLLDRVMEAHPSTVVLRRCLAAELGPVDEGLPGGYYEDYDYLLRAAQCADIASVNRPLVRILWGGTSYYTGRFEMIEQAVTHLIERHPDFAGVPRGKARLLGQIAFAQAGQGKRTAALRTSLDALRLDPSQPRAYLAMVASTGVVPAGQILSALNRRGRGI